MSKQVDFLVKLRDASLMLAGAASEYIESFAPPEVRAENCSAAVQETTFTVLKFESQQGAKLGEFEVAYKAGNIEGKWHHAYNVLRSSNSTINNRYHGQGYAYSYWLYGEDRIYRQKLKLKE